MFINSSTMTVGTRAISERSFKEKNSSGRTFCGLNSKKRNDDAYRVGKGSINRSSARGKRRDAAISSDTK